MIYTRDIIGDQWQVFVRAVMLGLLLGGCYDFLRMFRIIVHFGKKLFIASDFIYCIWSAFLIFSFLLNENFGIPRFYIFVGAAVGFFAWYFSIGKITPRAARLIRKILKAILSPFISIFRKTAKYAVKHLNKAKIFCAEALNSRKKLLKKKARLVYNILCLSILKVFPFCGGKTGKEPEKFESNGTEKTEEGIFPQNRGCCIRGVYSLFADIDTGGYQQKTDRTE